MLDGDLSRRLIEAASRRVSDHQDELSRLDSVAGDGDHGVNMATALAEATKRIKGLDDPTPAEVFRATGRAFHDSVGGAAGALFGSFFGAIGGQLNRSGNPAAPLDLVAGMEKGLARVMRVGRAEPGQKTMVDALSPAVSEARTAAGAGASLARVLGAAARSARQGAASTASMEPRAGRARYAAEQSIGTEDPGACTVALIFESWVETAE
ncbi:MAG: dihydroxyacetone kinase subunit DhaL [bacterium]|nr:dihydroxyacetone kinase subunit DhaL [bacterium]MDE0600531.1 dihydroxyacetone kinase subunit DhaL [bacterium]